jgi:hypothetical protein
MIALTPFICSLVLLVSTSTLASPVKRGGHGPLKFPTYGPSELCCRLPVIDQFLCPRQGGSQGPSVGTSLGTANGVWDQNGSGAMRFAVKYGSAGRWKPSSVVTKWQLP